MFWVVGEALGPALSPNRKRLLLFFHLDQGGLTTALLSRRGAGGGSKGGGGAVPEAPSFPTHLHHNVILLSYISTHQQYTKTWTELKLVNYASVFQNTVLDILKSNLTIPPKKISLPHNCFSFFCNLWDLNQQPPVSPSFSCSPKALLYSPSPFLSSYHHIFHLLFLYSVSSSLSGWRSSWN